MILLFIIYPIIIFFILLIVGIVFLILHINDITKKQLIITNTNTINKEYLKYTTNYYLMTFTELQFYKQIKKYIQDNNLEYEVFPQVNLERMIKVIDNNITDRNKIKSRSIDFTIVSQKKCKIVCCIELDDYTHKRENRIKRDIFINGLFEKVNIKLYRIQVKNDYINEIKNIFNFVINKEAL